ncbi:hypothetical protein [Deinococcus rufus]|uniref:Uncharacterized protein n=1 Tax=Deinococcus rufus TaxID=2136097 RepID=A0ABV7Z8X1_9DEIO
MRHARFSVSTLLLTLVLGLGVGLQLQIERDRRRVQREIEDLLSVAPPHHSPPVGSAPDVSSSLGGIVHEPPVYEHPDVYFHDRLGRILPAWLDTEPRGAARTADLLYRETTPDGAYFERARDVPEQQPGQDAPYWCWCHPQADEVGPLAGRALDA